ncbi:MAG: hypothetical protein EAZ43_01655 [Betaproteobacteria bacterium]|nr:MAG: hypothetical protein EAZ43_01655 [Betaproteobacteria bacterium]
MNSIRISKISQIVVAASLALAFSTAGFAQVATPAVKERQENQAQRINQGVASGELTKREAQTLRTEQRAIRAEKAAFKADGKVTAAERAQLRRDQKQASKRIHAKKHNAKKA